MKYNRVNSKNVGCSWTCPLSSRASCPTSASNIWLMPPLWPLKYNGTKLNYIFAKKKNPGVLRSQRIINTSYGLTLVDALNIFWMIVGRQFRPNSSPCGSPGQMQHFFCKDPLVLDGALTLHFCTRHLFSTRQRRALCEFPVAPDTSRRLGLWMLKLKAFRFAWLNMVRQGNGSEGLQTPAFRRMRRSRGHTEVMGSLYRRDLTRSEQKRSGVCLDGGWGGRNCYDQTPNGQTDAV